MEKISKFLLPAVFALAVWSAGCTENVMNGRLVIGITDDPFPIELIESATLTVFGVEAHPADAEEDEDMVVISTDTATFDLMKLRNGVVETLGDAEVPAGSYDYLRIYVSSASLTLTNGQSFEVKVPSGSTSGIKVKVEPAIPVDGGITAELLLDIDLSGSFVLNGAIDTPAGIKGFNFKPVIRAINLSEAGRVEGYVKDALLAPVAAAQLWLTAEGVTMSTYSEESGYYNIIGVPTGIHTLYAFKEPYDTVVIENVVIIAGNKTSRDIILK